MVDKCFESIVERCRYMASVAKVDCMRNALTAAADEIEKLRRGEFICQRCGLRKDGERSTEHEF